MFRSKYSNMLTIILIVAIIAILGLGAFIIFKWFRKQKINRDNEKVYSEFIDNNNEDVENTVNESTENIENIVEPDNTTLAEITNIETSGTPKTGSSTKKKKTYYPNTEFVVVGYIEIPKTKIKYAILDSASVKALEVAVAIAYPSNPKVNEPGNIVIQGHNYRNGTFFSNNKNLEVGDKIKITDTSNRTLTYTIYEKFETTAEDTSFFTRDTGDNIEISLSTCTNDSQKRLIILAKVQ